MGTTSRDDQYKDAVIQFTRLLPDLIRAMDNLAKALNNHATEIERGISLGRR